MVGCGQGSESLGTGANLGQVLVASAFTDANRRHQVGGVSHCVDCLSFKTTGSNTQPGMSHVCPSSCEGLACSHCSPSPSPWTKRKCPPQARDRGRHQPGCHWAVIAAPGSPTASGVSREISPLNYPNFNLLCGRTSTLICSGDSTSYCPKCHVVLQRRKARR